MIVRFPYSIYEDIDALRALVSSHRAFVDKHDYRSDASVLIMMEEEAQLYALEQRQRSEAEAVRHPEV